MNCCIISNITGNNNTICDTNRHPQIVMFKNIVTDITKTNQAVKFIPLNLSRIKLISNNSIAILTFMSAVVISLLLSEGK